MKPNFDITRIAKSQSKRICLSYIVGASLQCSVPTNPVGATA